MAYITDDCEKSVRTTVKNSKNFVYLIVPSSATSFYIQING